MASRGSAQSRVPSPHAVRDKRAHSVAFPDADEDEDDSTYDYFAKKQKLVISKLKLNYPLNELKQAMRGELLSTPALKYLLDGILAEGVDCKQDERRSLGSNKFFALTKAALKNHQEALVDVNRYLQAEAFIRIDNWSLINLREWFELVGKAGLEKDFRDLYWEENQRVFAIQIAKLASHVVKPPNSRVRELPLALTTKYGQDGKDIIARSVFVSGRGHPIIRSAAAIMVLAEYSDAEHIEKRQENTARVTQVWAAWCISKHQDEKEMQFLAALILQRIQKNDVMKACFLHAHEELRRCAQKANQEEFKKWQKMHWRCHVITSAEIRSRPVALPTVDGTQDTPGIPSDVKANAKTKTAAGSVKTEAAKRKSSSTSGPNIRHALASPIETTERGAIETGPPPTPQMQPDDPIQPQLQAQKSIVASQSQKAPLSLQVSHPSVASSTLTSPSPLVTATPASFVSPNQGTSPAFFDEFLSHVTSTLRNAYDSMERGKKVDNDGELLRTAMTNMSAEMADRIEPLHRRVHDNEMRVKELIDAFQVFGNRHHGLDESCRALGTRQLSLDNTLVSLADKQGSLDSITRQRLSSQSQKIQEQDRTIAKLQKEVGKVQEQHGVIAQLQREVDMRQSQDRVIGRLQRDVDFLTHQLKQQKSQLRLSSSDRHMDSANGAPKAPIARMVPDGLDRTPHRYERRDGK